MKKQHRAASDSMGIKDNGWNFKKIMEEIEFLGASHRTWKERKELENRKVVKLGGKPPKKQRLPLSVARAQMKNQKEREQKMLHENLIHGYFGGKFGVSSRIPGEKRKPEDRVLKSSEGHFRNGVLDVKHLLNSGSSRNNDLSTQMGSKEKKKKKGSRKKRKGKKKGGCRKLH